MNSSSQTPQRGTQSIGSSFRCAFAGIAHLLKTQRNARVHGVATALVVGLGVGLRVSNADWCWLVVATTAVWVAEAFNTALEVLADRVTVERDEAIRVAKDVSAAAVLIAAIGSAVIGILVLGRPLCQRLGMSA